MCLWLVVFFPMLQRRAVVGCRSAEDTDTGRKIAIKKVANLFYDAECAVKVLRETKLITRLRHENVRGRRVLRSSPWLVLSILSPCLTITCA